jgi:long-chain alkane monooxygenase
MTQRLRFNAFAMNCVSHIHHGQWVRSDTRQLEYATLDPWIELAQILERGKFDALFLADVIGTYDSYGASRDAAVQEGLQIPVNDPSLLIPAMAAATENLGFAFTHSVLQVIYKLLEGSWEDDAVIRDLERGVYADPSKIHDIDHVGEFYDVVGPHLSEPSPQRTPVLFQAGSSEPGREFAARNAEAIFIPARSHESIRINVADVRDRARRAGRDPDDVLFFVGLSFIVGGTEEEARRKEREIEEYSSPRGYAAHTGGAMGVDLAEIPLETPIGELENYNSRGFARSLIETAPDKTWTFGDLLSQRAASRIVGTPEQIADALTERAQAGVDGVNVTYFTTPGSFADFVDGVIPVLQERGLAQSEYLLGTLREKLSDGRAGPRLAPTHPGAAIRRERLAGVPA